MESSTQREKVSVRICSCCGKKPVVPGNYFLCKYCFKTEGKKKQPPDLTAGEFNRGE